MPRNVPRFSKKVNDHAREHGLAKVWLEVNLDDAPYESLEGNIGVVQAANTLSPKRARQLYSFYRKLLADQAREEEARKRQTVMDFKSNTPA